MSVRRESLRRSGSSGFVWYLKSVALWTGILTGCFLFGWLVVSPLINVAAGGRSSGAPSTQAANAMPAPPKRETSAIQVPEQRQEERRETRYEKPDIQLDVEKDPNQVQRTDSVDQGSESRRNRRRSRTYDELNNSQPSIESTESAPANDDSMSGAPVINDSSTTSEERRTTRRREQRSGQDSSSQEGRSRRRSRGEQTSPQSTDQGAGVQKSETVDN